MWARIIEMTLKIIRGTAYFVPDERDEKRDVMRMSGQEASCLLF
jgi:hypothetical protein